MEQHIYIRLFWEEREEVSIRDKEETTTERDTILLQNLPWVSLSLCLCLSLSLLLSACRSHSISLALLPPALLISFPHRPFSLFWKCARIGTSGQVDISRCSPAASVSLAHSLLQLTCFTPSEPTRRAIESLGGVRVCCHGSQRPLSLVESLGVWRFMGTECCAIYQNKNKYKPNGEAGRIRMRAKETGEVRVDSEGERTIQKRRAQRRCCSFRMTVAARAG